MIKIKPEKTTKFLRLTNCDWKPVSINKVKCPSCGIDTIKKGGGKWIGRCDTCNHIHSFLYPIPSQMVLIQLRAKILNMLGGTGSGKTTASCAIISETMRTKPGVKIVAFAQTEDQLNNTGKEELKKFFYRDEFVKYNQDLWLMRNGSRIVWYTSSSEQKIRGMNAGIIWLIESSGIKYEVFQQLMTRARQDELKDFARDDEGNVIYKYNEETKRQEAIVFSEYGMLINETNPTYEWPRDKALFKSHTVLYTPSVRGVKKLYGFVKPTIDPENDQAVLDMVSVLFASPDNPNMTEEYMSTIRMTYNNKAHYDRDIYCDMSFSEGLIYGAYMDDLFVSGIPSNKGVPVISEALDPGGAAKGNDESAYGLFKIFPASDPTELPDVYLVDGYKLSGLSTQEEAYNIWEVRNRQGFSKHEKMHFAVDPHGVKNEKKTKSNIIKDLRIWNVFMSKEGVNDDPDWGIKRMQDFMKAGKFHIVDNDFGKKVKDELSTYIWTDKVTTNREGRKVAKPYDRNNHALDMMRFNITKVYASPQALMKLGPGGYEIQQKKYSATSYDPYAMNDDKKEETEMSGNISGTGGLYYKE